MSRVRVLHVVSRSQRRGAERAALDLARALDELGCEDDVVALARAFDESEINELPSLTRQSSRGWRTLAPEIRALHTQLERHPFDIVLAHGGRAAEVAALARRGQSPPVVWQRILGFPPSIARPPRRLWWQFVSRRINAAVALNAPLASELRALGFRGPIWTIANFRDMRRFSDLDRLCETDRLRDELRIAKDVPLLGFVGRLVEQKRPDRALDVLAEVHRLGVTNAHLVVVGDGPLRSDVERGVASRGLNGYVHLLGDRDDVERILAGIDVFVLTSDDEGIPGVVIEAEMAGCCVVVPDIGGLAELVTNRETGMITSRSDARELAAAVVDVVRDSDRRRQMGDKARKFAAQFSSERAAASYLARFEELLARGRT
jgi:glycosyltransferase involved in cell wall biosynthesis